MCPSWCCCTQHPPTSLTVTLTTLSLAFPLLMPSVPTQVRSSSAQACRPTGDHKLTQALRDQIFQQTFYQVPSQVWALREYNRETLLSQGDLTLNKRKLGSERFSVILSSALDQLITHSLWVARISGHLNLRIWV